MKKKMIALVALLLAVVVTGYSVSGTYAKYTSAGGFEDAARVAKWGITLNKELSESVNLFKDSYTQGIQSNNGEKVIAPGAYGSYAFDYSSFSSATPEVNFDLKAAVKVEDNTKALKFAVTKDGSNAYTTAGTAGEQAFVEGTYGNYNLSADELEKLLAKLLTGTESSDLEGVATSTKSFKASELKGSSESLKGLGGSYTIYWMWDFEDENDTRDTQLGNDEGSYASKKDSAVSINVNITATQTQEG